MEGFGNLQGYYRNVAGGIYSVMWREFIIEWEILQKYKLMCRAVIGGTLLHCGGGEISCSNLADVQNNRTTVFHITLDILPHFFALFTSLHFLQITARFPFNLLMIYPLRYGTPSVTVLGGG